jgi:small subunit ribosomal protein S16
MAVHIRLQRRGTTHRPFYHVVAADHRCPRDGKFIEKLGYYDPLKNPSIVELKEERIQQWYEKGAQLTPATKKLVKIKNISLARKNTKAADKA